jgi:hypothetical protein
MNSVSLSSIIKTTTYRSWLVGIRWSLILTLVVVWGVSQWLRSEYGQDDSNQWLVMNLFLQLTKWTLIGLISISLLSAFITWLFFINSVKNHRLTFQAKFGDGQKAEAGWVPLKIMILGSVLRPLLGTIQAHFIFSQQRISDRLILDNNVLTPRNWWRQGIWGSGQTLLHDRGIYDVEKILVVFCDALGLISLPYTVSYTQQLYTLPRLQPEQKQKAQPNSTEEQKHRIEIPKRVEGEHVNYKEFEAGDNIQRIVWKIYAKSGQLVVRIPETKDPYASHVYFYASFFHGYNLQVGAFEGELLNVYKDKLRNLLEALQENGYEVRLPKDQELPKLAGLSEKKNELFQITAASWQNKLSPDLFINYSNAAFVSLSSLTPATVVETILRKLPLSVPLVVVKLSDAIPSPFQVSLKDVFFKPEKQPVDRLRQPWLLSSLRKGLQKNEKEIAAILKQRGNSWLTNTIGFEK